MRKSFYTWLMTERNPKSNAPKALLADLAFHESAFPKHTDDFDEVSRYLEEHASFSFNLGDFDAILMRFGKNTKPTRKGQVEDGFFSASLL